MSDLDPMERLDFHSDRTPRRDFWSLFKVASLQRLTQMQQGLLYMNSLEYFSTLKGEEAIALRQDEKEKVFASLKAGKNGDYFGVLSLEVGEGDEKREIDLGDKAIMTANFPHYENTMLFCMGAIADDASGKIPGEKNEKLYFDKRFLEFGDHILLILNPHEFSNRINEAIKKEKHIFNYKFLEGGYGLVDYLDLSNYSGIIGLYKKDIEYSWQQEFRIAFGIKENALNQNRAYEFNVGDLSDISTIIPLQSLIDEPMKFKRRMFQKVNNEYIQIHTKG